MLDTTTEAGKRAQRRLCKEEPVTHLLSRGGRAGIFQARLCLCPEFPRTKSGGSVVSEKNPSRQLGEQRQPAPWRTLILYF